MSDPELITGRSEDALLVPEGEAEALSKGWELAARGIIPDRVFSSSATRCVQSGALILEGLGLRRLEEQALSLAPADRSVLAIAHKGLITHTVGTIEGWDQPESLAMMQTMPPMGETLIVFDGSEWHVQSFAQPKSNAGIGDSA
jgi:broad specificity phosphatase PhoE